MNSRTDGFYAFLIFQFLRCALTTGMVCSREGEPLECCVNNYEVNRTCLECPNGWFGINCSVLCPANYYGRFCGNACNCSSEYQCHHVNGCILLSTAPSDHAYCSYGNEKVHPRTCNAECQTNLTLQDIEKSEAELLQLRETLRDKDDLKRYLLVDSDSSVKSFFGLSSVVTLFGIFVPDENSEMNKNDEHAVSTWVLILVIMITLLICGSGTVIAIRTIRKRSFCLDVSTPVTRRKTIEAYFIQRLSKLSEPNDKSDDLQYAEIVRDGTKSKYNTDQSSSKPEKNYCDQNSSELKSNGNIYSTHILLDADYDKLQFHPKNDVVLDNELDLYDVTVQKSL